MDLTLKLDAIEEGILASHPRSKKLVREIFKTVRKEVFGQVYAEDSLDIEPREIPAVLKELLEDIELYREITKKIGRYKKQGLLREEI